ncbi:LysR family transcriptional regulator [Pilimelia anulata]|uniref:LysR family transcriptional regulator n=1 Tax=Pilimelia anulata TaxID=53371 RepID=A0A8J3BI95_9ACTN|nr:LysR family transcriptional regulator [Pilimelia anulata]GGK10366.1 LysR family transcriptional regulator [Pilimelia anulata]
MELDFRHLRLVRAVARCGSLTAAAAVLGMAQPSASTALCRAERIVGGKLFHRTIDGLVATELGATVAAHALTILGALEQFEESARKNHGRSARATVRVGATPGPLAAVLPRIIDLALGAVSDVRIGFNGRYWLNLLVAGHLDAALVVDFPAAELSSPHTVRRVVAVEPVFVGLPERHRLADRAQIDLRELAGEVFAEMSDAGPSIQSHLAAACAGAGFTPATAILDLNDVHCLAQRPRTVLLMKPTSQPPPGMVAVPLAGTPLHMVTSLHAPVGRSAVTEQVEQLAAELVRAQRQIVAANGVYHAWQQRRHGRELLAAP